MMAIPESDDRIQRALNDAKRAELRDRFGGVFIGGDIPLPAEIESEFLQRIEEFELKWASRDTTTVRAFIGDPPVKDPSELAEHELAEELAYLTSALEDNDIALDFAERPDDAEVYRFIVEELLDHEMDDIRVPGMVCHFLYEEFHPNEELEARYAAEWFLERLLTRNEYLATSLARCEAIDGGTANVLDVLHGQVVDFMGRVATIMSHDLSNARCLVDGATATVLVDVQWSGLESGSMNEVGGAGEARVQLRKNAFSEWEVVAAEIPGW